MTVLPCPGASACRAPSSSASATATAPKARLRRCRATSPVNARVARSTPSGRAAGAPALFLLRFAALVEGGAQQVLRVVREAGAGAARGRVARGNGGAVADGGDLPPADSVG